MGRERAGSGAERLLDVEQVRAWVCQLALPLREALGEFIAREDPEVNAGPRWLVQALYALVSHIVEQLGNFEKFQSYLPEQRRPTHLHAITKALGMFRSEFLLLAEEAVRGDVFPGLTTWVEEIASRLSLRCHIFLAPIWEDNFKLDKPMKSLYRYYTFHGDQGQGSPGPNAREADSEQAPAGSHFLPPPGIMRGYPRHLMALRVSRSRSHDCLAYALCAHELGHAAEVVHGVVQKVVDESGQGDIRLKRPSALANRAGSWLGELVSDYVAVGLAGPAYFIAFEEFALGRLGVRECNDDHPPPWMRLNVILMALRDMGYEEKVGRLTRVTARGPRVDQAALRQLREAAEKLVERMSYWRGELRSLSPKPCPYPDELVQAMGGYIGKLSLILGLPWFKELNYPPGHLCQHLPQLFTALKDRLPPCEVYGPRSALARSGQPSNRPAPFVSVLNTAALYLLLQQSAGLDPEVAFQKRKKDCELIAKAFELSDIHQRFRTLLREGQVVGGP